jgi:Icc-related predicted phosphoesterase
VNCAENKFLDTQGSNDVACWNNNGCNIQYIIKGNTSRWAKNIRWWLLGCNSIPIETVPTFSNSIPIETVPNNQKKVRILHLSDTHCMHHTIESKFPMPEADILLHTGDFTNRGSEEEVKFFNTWLGELKARYPVIIIIIGNHDRWSGFNTPTLRSLLNNATVLENEEVQVYGLRIYGISWSLKQPDGSPDSHPSKEFFYKIPENLDILMTHCPPYQIFDLIDEVNTWGSSKFLREAIELKKPKVHLFGHLHEQRGVWIKNPGSLEYTGGIEFKPWPYPSQAPPANYPCQLISCNAMKNHESWDNLPCCIAGPARLITATQKKDVNWVFSI